MSSRSRRFFFALGGLFLVVTLAAAAPIVVVEGGCGRGISVQPSSPSTLVSDPAYRRAEGDSYLTYPEWFIVHAYADLAGVVRATSESRYDYAAAIGTFWSSMCRASAAARAVGPVTIDQRITNDIIGLSFTLEMAVQGGYERTVGAVTAWLRGDAKTPEDLFNLRFLDDYAAFLQQAPWYQYPFKAELIRFWKETPWSLRSPIRSVERRISLSIEYAAKGIYAVAIGALAGASPAELTILSVIREADLSAVDGVLPVRDLKDGLRLVQTARYAAFSNILRTWARNGTNVIEIAGNHHILITVLAPRGTKLNLPEAVPIFTIPLQSRPGWERIGFNASVPALTAEIRAVSEQGGTFEHAYDY